MAEQFLPKPVAVSQWAPLAYISPCFEHFRPDDFTLRCLTKTQIALHEQRLLYDALLRDAASSKEEWEHLRAALEDQLRGLQVRNAEAERLFKIQEMKLDTRLQRTQTALRDLDTEHKQLKDASAAKIQELQGRVQELTRQCGDLEDERKHLQHALRDFEITAQARREAERRVRELESGIAALKDRAQQMMRELAAQRDDAEQARDQLAGRLATTQQALVHEGAARQSAENTAFALAIEKHRLAAALELEQLINEPLRHTNHATTTVAHVMRSLASPMVSDRSRIPLHPSYLPSPPPRGVPVPSSPGAVDYAVRPASSPGLASYQAQHQQQAEGTSQAGHLHPSSASASTAAAVHHSPARPAMQVLSPWGSPSAPHYQVGITHPSMARSVAGNNLARLGRAWATTTTTAGHPHPVFVDNVPRHVPFYASLARQSQQDTSRPLIVGGQPRSSSVGGARRPLSAGAASSSLHYAPISVGVATPVRPKASKPKPAGARPSANIVTAYHDSLAAADQPKHPQPNMTDTMSSAATVEYTLRPQ